LDNPDFIYSQVRQIAIDDDLRKLDKSLLASVGDSSAPNNMFIIVQPSCEACRAFMKDNFDEIIEQYSDNKKLVVYVMPWWSGDWTKNNLDFEIHYVASCASKDARMDLIVKLFDAYPALPNSIDGLYKYVESWVRNQNSFRQCLSNNERRINFADGTLKFAKIAAGQPSRVFINGAEVNVRFVDEIKRRLEYYVK
jgi:hypothetical protein